MGTYEELVKARELFGIGEEETMAEVKRKINALLKKWHPDTGGGKDADSGSRNEKTAVLLKAKKSIMAYCDGYRISFNQSDVEKYISPAERWIKNFGGDHVWGGNG